MDFIVNVAFSMGFLDIEGEGLSIERQGSEREGVVSFFNTNGAPPDTPHHIKTPIKLGLNTWQVRVVRASGVYV